MGRNRWGEWTPAAAAAVWRVSGLLLLCLIWLTGDSGGGGEQTGILLLLLLAVLILARWRFKLPGWTILADQAACLIAFVYWPPAAIGLALPIFEAMLRGKPWFALPALIAAIARPDLISLLLAVGWLQAVLAGCIIRGWTRALEKYVKETDRLRRDRYEWESLKEELLLANIQGVRMAELSERNRIARQLHDEMGHELTASVLALQACEQLWKEGDPAARDMFLQARQRVVKSTEYLRETVHNMKPVKEPGIDDLRDICRQFTVCPIELQMYGDTSKVPVYIWNILRPCLQEALTNIIRHARPAKVDITLDSSPHIVRLSVHNDGMGTVSPGTGMGLRNLRQRARAAGGSISTDTSDGFRLVCVLPIGNQPRWPEGGPPL